MMSKTAAKSNKLHSMLFVALFTSSSLFFKLMAEGYGVRDDYF